MVLPRRLVPTLPSLRHCRVRMSQPSEGERAGQRERKGAREKESDEGEDGERTRRKKERKRDRNETVGPRVGCSPNSSTCPQDASNNIALISEAQTQERRIFDPCRGRVMIATCSAGPGPGSPVHERLHVACTWPRKRSGVPRRKFLSRR